VGVKGGCEALVHAARHFVSNMDKDKAFIKLDFSNAFNSIRRDALLEAVTLHRPDLLHLTASAYGSPSILWTGETSILSAEGIQQGDPLGPLLFCLTLDSTLKSLDAEFLAGYLDDVSIGDTVPRLISQVRALEVAASAIGLQLNQAKCEIIGLDPSQSKFWKASGLDFVEVGVDDSTLLGSPLALVSTNASLLSSRLQLARIRNRLLKLPAHEAFFLLKSSLGIPKIQFLLRSSPCFLSPEVILLDNDIRDLLASILNVRLDTIAWSQASLPVRWGGIGIRSPSVLATSSFLASCHASAQLVVQLLPLHLQSNPEAFAPQAMILWQKLANAIPIPLGPDACRQRCWDDGPSLAISSQLLLQAGPVARARLLASSSPGSGAWLHALPFSNLGLRLANDELRTAVGLRHGCPLVRPHKCICRSEVNELGYHGLSCIRSAGRHRRHALANDVIVRAIRSAGIHAELEPTRLLRGDGKRPDGASLDPWDIGMYLVWDFTCPDTLAPSHLQLSSSAAGSVAERAEGRKVAKYAELVASGNYSFMPVAIETLGTWGPSALALCADIGRRLASVSGDPRSHAFLLQRLSLAIQRGNAAAVVGTLPNSDNRWEN